MACANAIKYYYCPQPRLTCHFVSHMWDRCVQRVLQGRPHTSAYHSVQLRYCLKCIGHWDRFDYTKCPTPETAPTKLKSELKYLFDYTRPLRKVVGERLIWLLRASVVCKPDCLQKYAISRLTEQLESLPVLWWLVHCFRTLVWSKEYGCVHDALARRLSNVIFAKKVDKPLILLLKNAVAGHYDGLTC